MTVVVVVMVFLMVVMTMMVVVMMVVMIRMMIIIITELDALDDYKDVVKDDDEMFGFLPSCSTFA